MKRKLAFIVYLFYKYYSKGATKSIAYESAIMATSFLIFLNLAALTICFSLHKEVYTIINSENGYIKLLKGTIILIPQIVALVFVFRKSYIIGLKFEKSTVILGNRILLGYFIFSFLLVALLAIKDIIF